MNLHPLHVRVVPAAMLTLLAACQAPRLPEGAGKGVLGYDRAPEDGVRSYPRPAWTLGDRFVYRRGGLVRLPFRVVEKTDAGYVLEHEETGTRVRLTVDLAAVSEESPGQSLPSRVQAPPDVQLHWPLWVGKRWNSHFLRKSPGAALPLLASYHCDAVESVTVPAGQFECLRIWRTVRVTAAGNYQERTALMWYAPEVGYFVRRLEDGTLLELEEYHRQ